MELEELLNMKISETQGIMRSKEETEFVVAEDDTIKDVAEKTQKLDFGAVVLVNSEGKAKKLISKSDVVGALLKGVELKPDSMLSVVENDVGNDNFVKVSNSATIGQVHDTLVQTNHSYVIVESDDHEPVGVITSKNLREAYEKLKEY